MILAACQAPGGGSPRGTPITITLVEVVVAESLPPQVFAHVRGEPPGGPEGCWSYPARPAPVRAGNAVTVTIVTRPCAGAQAPWVYDESILLGSDFAAGDYTLSVNEVTQTFRVESGFGP